MASILDRFFKKTTPVGTEDESAIPNNPAGGEFMDSVKSSIKKSIDKFSVTANSLIIGNNSFNRGGNPFGAAGVLTNNTNVDSSFGNTDLGLALPVDTNKIARIQSYDNLARYPELDWCINEIANDFLHADINGEYLKLRLNCSDSKFNDGEDTVLQEEFKNLVSMYDLKTTGYNMIRKFLIEGEICFENVIDYHHPEYGIIGFKYMPTMFYDFLRNRQTGQIEGLYIDPERLKTYTQFSTYGGTSYAGQSSTVFNAIRQVPAYSYTYSLDMKNKIIMPFEQVTYMNSGTLSEDGSVVFPIIERVAVPTRQLLLMHDAMVIYRITRAPEKLVFNIDLAGMPAKKAEQVVRQMSMAHKSRKAVQGSGAVTNVYNAETMLDAYYFWKIGEGGGTQVQSLASTAHYNELHDVEYFLKRILKFLSIPWQRWSESAANRQDKQSIQNEEYSFAQSIVRYQTMFSAAVKKTFITHLRMKGLFRKYDLHESEIEVEMIPPALYENYQAQTRFKDALDIVNSAASVEFLSKNLLLKTVFNFTDTQIRENEVETRREALFKVQTEWMGEQIKAGKGDANIYLDNEKYLDKPPEATPAANGQQPPPPDANGGGGMDQQQPPMDANGGQPSPPPDQGGTPPTDNGAAPQGAATPDANGGGEQQNDAANAGFGEFANSDNINQTTPEEIEKTDDSGKTDAERQLQKNPKFGDFGELNSIKNEPKIKQYPETNRGIKALRGGKDEPSLTDVFKDTFELKDDEKDKSLHDVFTDEFGKVGKERSLTDVFNDEFNNDEEDEEKYGKEQSLSSVFDKIFNSNDKDEKISDNASLSDIFHKEFGKKHAGRYTKHISLDTALDKMFKD